MIERFEDFTSNIALANKSILKIKAHEMEKFGLKASHVMCLYYLGKYPEGLTAGELVKLCEEDKAAVSKNVATLKEKGMLYLDDDNGAKKYRAKYVITEEGKAVYEKISKIILQAVASCSADLTDEERNTFYKSLETIAMNLEKYYQQLGK